MEICKKLIYLIAVLSVLCFFPLQSYAVDEETTIAFSVDDYLQAKKTGESFSIDSLPISKDIIDQWPSEFQKPKVESNSFLSPYIIGGNDASRNEYPEYVLLLAEGDDGNFYAICGGTLIAQNKVLTAAHCAQLPVRRYYAIPNFYSFTDRFNSGDFYKVTEIANHPSYDSSTSDYDISVLTLSRNAYTSVASIHAGSNQFVGENSTVIGTGRTRTEPADYSNILQEVDVPIVSNKVCNDQWNSTLGFKPVTARMMCAGFSTDGRGSCFGDSGGPLLTDIDGQRAVVGTVSFGYSICENSRQSAVYARTGVMYDFIAAQSPNTNFIYSDNLISLIPVYNLLFDDTSPPTRVNPAALYPPIQTPISEKYVIKLESAPGDFIGEGRNYTFMPQNTNFSIAFESDASLYISIDNHNFTAPDNWWWFWHMEAGSGEAIQVGTYDNAAEYPFNFNGANGLSFSGDGRGCNGISGRFRVFEIEYVGRQVTKLAADFIQYCGSSTAPMKGSIRYDSSKP